MNAEWARASRVVDASDAVRVGTDRATVPEAWIDLLTGDPAERALWRLREFRKSLG